MRLIDADHFLKTLEQTVMDDKADPAWRKIANAMQFMVNAEVLFFPAEEMIGHLPNIDHLPVTRCKDCEFYTEEERWCRRLGLCGAFDQNGYCSHAERKEE